MSPFLDLKCAAFRQLTQIRAIRSLIKALRFLYGKQPVPLKHWLRCRSIVKLFCHSPDPFFSARGATQIDCASLPAKDLADFLRDDSITGWTLDGETITFYGTCCSRSSLR